MSSIKMSRPILSRPRTRVYGCNYDKGESYYKPMVDHLDRKYSGRPLFSEPRTSLADEIAARRGDIGSRNQPGNQNDSYDDLDFMYDRGPQDELEHDFVTAQRRYKNRAAAAFEEDLAELRRKRRDMQDRLFDVIDLNAEIEKARNTLEAAGLAFQRHATKFDNDDREDMSLTEKLDRSRKIASMEVVPEKPPQQKSMALKWAKIPPVDIESYVPQPTKQRQHKISSLVDAAGITDPLDLPAIQPLKSRFLKRKKSVSF